MLQVGNQRQRQRIGWIGLDWTGQGKAKREVREEVWCAVQRVWGRAVERAGRRYILV